MERPRYLIVERFVVLGSNRLRARFVDCCRTARHAAVSSYRRDRQIDLAGEREDAWIEVLDRKTGERLSVAETIARSLALDQNRRAA